jgi:hypothetical protein
MSPVNVFLEYKKTKRKKKRAKRWPRASSRPRECGPEAKPMLLTMFFFFYQRSGRHIVHPFFLKKKSDRQEVIYHNLENKRASRLSNPRPLI